MNLKKYIINDIEYNVAVNSVTNDRAEVTVNGVVYQVKIENVNASCPVSMPVVETAKITSEIGVPTTIITTTPFHFEGKNRQELAEDGLSDLRNISKNVIVVHNEDIKNKIEGKVTFARAFSAVDDFVTKTIQDHIKML